MNEDKNQIKELEKYLSDLSWSERKPDSISQFVSDNLGIQCDVKISPFKRKINLTFHVDDNTNLAFDFNASSKFCDKQELNGKVSVTFKI